jgi:hypothetical protein
MSSSGVLVKKGYKPDEERGCENTSRYAGDYIYKFSSAKIGLKAYREEI